MAGLLAPLDAYQLVKRLKTAVRAPIHLHTHYTSGMASMSALMAVLGIVAKLRVPYAHTSLEIIKIRYGKYAHWLFILLNLINNIFGCGSMILAGAQLVTGMTGMHIVAACVLIPAGGEL